MHVEPVSEPLEPVGPTGICADDAIARNDLLLGISLFTVCCTFVYLLC